MLRSLGRLTEALTTTEAAVERLPAGVSPGLVADLHQVLAFAYCVRGDLDESARATDEALRLAPPHEVEARSSALLNRGQLALIRLEPSAARAVFRSVRLVLLIGGHAGARTAPGAGGTRALDRPPARGRDRARGAAVSRRE
jgi:tetratricopeptide (TPR) repeat protein